MTVSYYTGNHRPHRNSGAPMNRNRKITAVTVLAAAGLALTACGHDNFKDLHGVKNVHPDYIENVENMDGHPNLGFLCVHGVPLITTTRSNAGDLRVVSTPAAVRFCAKQIGHAS